MVNAEPRTVVWRAVNRGRIRWAMAAYELARTDDYVVLHVPVGSPGVSRDGPREGPREGFLRPANYGPGFTSIRWKWRDLVAVHRFGESWSTWRWIDEDAAWTSGAYVDLERPWTGSVVGWDTEDLTLDVLVAADGTVTYKDEDELAWAEGLGVYSATEAEHIRSIGRLAHQHATSRGWPLDENWTDWRPDPAVAIPSLPINWAESAM